MKMTVLHQPLFRLLAPVLFGLLVYLTLLLLNNQAAQLDQLFRSQEMYVCMLLAALQSELLRWLILKIEKRVPGERRRWWLLVTAGNSLTVLTALTALWFYYVYGIGFPPGSGELWRFAALYLPGGWFLIALYASQFYLRRQNTAAMSREVARRSMLEQEFSDFSHELAPELLYRSLEQLLLLMHQDQQAAEDFLNLLAQHYRYRLLNRREEVVPLAAELEAAGQYARLLGGIRRQEIVLETTGVQTIDAQLPPGSLVTGLFWLLANSITEPGACHIQVALTGNELQLSATSREKLIRDADSAYAFERLCRSYQILSDRPPKATANRSGLQVKLPLLQLKPLTTP